MTAKETFELQKTILNGLRLCRLERPKNDEGSNSEPMKKSSNPFVSVINPIHPYCTYTTQAQTQYAHTRRHAHTKQHTRACVVVVLVVKVRVWSVVAATTTCHHGPQKGKSISHLSLPFFCVLFLFAYAGLKLLHLGTTSDVC